MRLYHGTCTRYIDDIKREGLRICHSNQWHIQNLDAVEVIGAIEFNDAPHVYLTKWLYAAQVFAKARADYEKAKYGDIVSFGGNPMIKLSNESHAALPVVLTVEVDADFPIHEDATSAERIKAYWTNTPIPATSIKKVEIL